MPGEIVQNRRYPDGLLQAFLGNAPKPRHVLVEIATFPERRALKQATDDLALAYSALGQLPELLMLVLCPKGKFRIDGKHTVQSKLGLARLQAEWKVIELWTLSAEEYLAQGDVGTLPWVPLMQMQGPPEPILERCAARIEREADAQQRMDMLVVSHVFAGLRFPNLDLMSFFGGMKTMVESPVIQKLRADAQHGDILDLLKDRFGPVPRDVTKTLREVLDEKKLRRLNRLAAKCADLNEFRNGLEA
jgi:hypothetical protein